MLDLVCVVLPALIIWLAGRKRRWVDALAPHHSHYSHHHHHHHHRPHPLQTDQGESGEEEDDDEFGDGVGDGAGGLRAARDEDDIETEDPEAAALKLSVHEVDAFWLQRQLGKYYEDANASAKLAEEVLQVLATRDELECESRLVVLLDVDKFDFIKRLLRNRGKVLYCTRLKQAQTDAEKKAVEAEMLQDVELGGPAILEALYQKASAESWAADRQGEFVRKTKGEARTLNQRAADAGKGVIIDEDQVGFVPPPPEAGAGGTGGAGAGAAAVKKPEKTLDLEALSFAQGGHLNSNKKVVLPEGTWRALKKGYEEVHVPAIKHIPDASERLVEIEELPAWTHKAFSGMTMLNRVQSKMCKAAFYSPENLLLCAPTGAGKTNVAMLCMLNEIGQHLREDGSVNLDAFKIVYVAPMKALVQECVLNFGKRLEPYGITVRELSGDQSLTRQQINETQVRAEGDVGWAGWLCWLVGWLVGWLHA
jgi:pre-mRNA-splicing helicase BRR2